jgi:hypothetical protein
MCAALPCTAFAQNICSHYIDIHRGARGSVVGWGTIAISRKVAGSIPDEAIGFFQPRYGPEVDSASNRNEYQESSWE